MAAKPLTANQKAMLNHLADAGDIQAKAGVFAQESSAMLLSLGAPAAKGTTNVHAALAGTAAVAFPGPFTNPDTPRNLRYVFAASYDGGDITVTGTAPGGKVQTETVTAVASSTVVGTKVFATVTSAVRSAVGVNAATVSIGTGDKLGLGTIKPASGSPVMLFVAGVAEAGTYDSTNNGIAPTTAPDGTKVFVVMFNR